MDEIGSDPVLLRLIIKYVHHMNITFVAIQHSLWFRGLKDNATVRYERVFSSTIPHFFYRYYEILPTCC